MLTNKKEVECLCFMNVEIGGGGGLSLPPVEEIQKHELEHVIAHWIDGVQWVLETISMK
jgi:hypothetical protein